MAGLARERLVWAGGWLEPPYEPRPMAAATRSLADLAEAFGELIEQMEEQDPVRNAAGVQVCSLAFAIVGSVGALLERAKDAQTA